MNTGLDKAVRKGDAEEKDVNEKRVDLAETFS